MNLPESVIQSQLAHNAQVIYQLERNVGVIKENWRDELAEYRYYAGLNVDEATIKTMNVYYLKSVSKYKVAIAKYVKLQKALKAELKLVRERKKRGAIVEAFITQQVNKLLLEK